MKKQHLSLAPLTGILQQQDSQRLLAAVVRITGLHRLGLATEIVQKTFEDAVAKMYFRIPSDYPAFLLKLAQARTLDTVRQHNLTEKLAKEVSFQIELGEPMEAIFQRVFSEAETTNNWLGLVFGCCHPGLPVRVRMALLLKVGYVFTEKDQQHFRHSEDIELLKVLNDVPDLLVQNAVHAGVPSTRTFDERYKSVLEALWHLFFEGFDHSEKTTFARRSICNEAFRLCGLMMENPLTQKPVTTAMMSIFCMLAARFDPRRGRSASFHFLDEKNRGKWAPNLVEMGVQYYEKAGEPSELSLYHLYSQALMEHTLAPHPKFTNWPRIMDIYAAILKIDPSFNNHLCLAWALAKCNQPDRAIQYLFSVPNFAEHLQDDWLTSAFMGEFYRQGKNVREAIRYFRMAQSKAPGTGMSRMMFRKVLALEKGKMKKKKRRW